MKGEIEIKLNDETIRAALQMYFTKVVFDPSQIATVKVVTPRTNYAANWEYFVTVECENGEGNQ